MSLSQTYLSVKQLLADNITHKGVLANKNDGLTTLANKVSQISSNMKMMCRLNETIDFLSIIQINEYSVLETKISDSSDGNVTYTNVTINNEVYVKRSVNGWSNHGIIDLNTVIENDNSLDIDISSDIFSIEADFLMQDGFECPGLFIADDNSNLFYQMCMQHNGGYFDGYDDRTHWILITNTPLLTQPPSSNILNMEEINISYIHQMKLFFLEDAIFFELLTKDSNDNILERYNYTLSIANFSPTRVGLNVGYLGSKDRGGNNLAFNNLVIRQYQGNQSLEPVLTL